MSNDNNNNGIEDSGEIAFHWKSVLAGAVLALALGGSIIGLGKAFMPNSQSMKAIGKWFAGSACDDIENALYRCRDAWSCIEGGAAIQGTDISICAGKLKKVE